MKFETSELGPDDWTGKLLGLPQLRGLDGITGLFWFLTKITPLLLFPPVVIRKFSLIFKSYSGRKFSCKRTHSWANSLGNFILEELSFWDSENITNDIIKNNKIRIIKIYVFSHNIFNNLMIIIMKIINI